MNIKTFEHILEVTKSLTSSLPVLSSIFETERRLTDDVIAQLKAIGVFKMNFPKSWGGLELTSAQQTQVIEQLAIGDPAVAWCAMIGSDSGIYSGYLNEEVAKKLFTINTITAGWIHPQGIAEEVPGGYLVSGNWRFGSGLSHCNILSAGCFVYRNGTKLLDENEKPIWRVMLAKPSEYHLKDNWFTTGLAGSGSRDYSAKNMFVPYEHSFSFLEPHRSGPLFDTPDAILRNMSGIPLGMARAAIDYIKGLVDKKYDRSLSVSWRLSPRVQSVIAKCEIDLYAARCAVYSSLSEQWDALIEKKGDDEELRVRPALARHNAFKTVRKIIAELYDLNGGASIYKNESPLDRWLRDSYTICQHAVASDSILQQCGQYLLEGKSNNLFI
ncbi:acyl-CoA dehydrogenase family protein [Xenorhabdus kozodoii]|uniref:Acyl-CoA dehydrogenase n=1 Tax=Xenorhabdus kozodoii TaxID=351676 RepID=A0A2D0L2V3_9GAMM|nr:acyl-CoA dehydrogenase family protein [Xenorhabdus kozodoii]PHM70010.1 acyl-CoA dehydrogenase [Xenorhabdus kozodoii]